MLEELRANAAVFMELSILSTDGPSKAKNIFSEYDLMLLRERWCRLSEQIFRVAKWSLGRG
jgi:hypothetical protein